MGKFLKNKEELINEQIDAAVYIKDKFGIEKAIGYIIGEKFYNLIKELKYLKENFQDEPEDISGIETLITKYAGKIKKIFTEKEIDNYFKSNPIFGPLGHILTEEEYNLFVSEKAVNHTINKEIEDALTMGEIKKYLKIVI